MLLSTRMLLATVLCLCFAAPSPVLSFTGPDENFGDNQMTNVGEEGQERSDINSIANTLIRQVFGAAEEREEATEEDEGVSLSKRAQGNRPEREIRGRAHMFPLGRRPNAPVTTRSKFTFGKRSLSPLLSRPTTQELFEELQRQAEEESWRNRAAHQMALFNDAALIDGNLQDDHQVQKDGYAVFPFGKRGMSAFSYGKRAMPSFAFGKRGMPSFAFGKRGLGGSAFAFGRRDWVPTEQDSAVHGDSGNYQDKRGQLAFSFGKRYDQ